MAGHVDVAAEAAVVAIEPGYGAAFVCAEKAGHDGETFGVERGADSVPVRRRDAPLDGEGVASLRGRREGLSGGTPGRRLSHSGRPVPLAFRAVVQGAALLSACNFPPLPAGIRNCINHIILFDTWDGVTLPDCDIAGLSTTWLSTRKAGYRVDDDCRQPVYEYLL
jgi:hypothetical protein